jgi:hypothetical protein
MIEGRAGTRYPALWYSNLERIQSILEVDSIHRKSTSTPYLNVVALLHTEEADFLPDNSTY